jgi:PEP-CTERM motif
MNKILLMGVAAAALISVGPASAALQIAITDGTTTFTCKDGQLGCDQSGGANNLLVVNTTVDGFFVEIALTQSTFGDHNILQLSTSDITNNGTSPGTLTFVASDTGFTAPVSSIEESASLTFNRNIGASNSTLQFFADPANAQGANPLNTPGTLLDSVSGAASTDPDSFAGTKTESFIAGLPFSMTESAAISLVAGGSVTGFNESMTSSAVPEPSTWAMLVAGFGMLGFFGFRKSRKDRLNVAF